MVPISRPAKYNLSPTKGDFIERRRCHGSIGASLAFSQGIELPSLFGEVGRKSWHPRNLGHYLLIVEDDLRFSRSCLKFGTGRTRCGEFCAHLLGFRRLLFEACCVSFNILCCCAKVASCFASNDLSP